MSGKVLERSGNYPRQEMGMRELYEVQMEIAGPAAMFTPLENLFLTG